MQRIKILAAPVAVATTDTVLTVNTKNDKNFGLEVKNVGANALDAFEVWGYMSDEPTAGAFLLLNADANFTTPVYPCVKASAGPVALAAGASVYMDLNVQAFTSIVFKASAAVGATTLNFHGNTKS